MKPQFHLAILSFSVLFCGQIRSQQTDATVALHALQPEYPVPYTAPTTTEVLTVIDRVYGFLEENTAKEVVVSETKKPLIDFKNIKTPVEFEEGAFRLTSYEWGVTYAGMLLASEATGKPYFKDYANSRIALLSKLAKGIKNHTPENSPIYKTIHPHALDDAGALCAAFIKAKKQGLKAELDPIINIQINYISEEQFRLADGTLARNRPQNNSLWLDDLFMSVPALAQMGSYTGETKYFDDAVKQVKQFSERMFNEEKGIYMHGWLQDMDHHPQFHWARANGWAIMAMVELLDVLPKNHPGYPMVLQQVQKHIEGLIQYQDGTGFWHQLLDRNDSYLETSATAIYTYAIARAINKGYIDPMAFSPAVLLAWNAVSTKVNDLGQVMGTCVGTGMGFDPAFYYYRPVNLYAAHGYGPVLLAGAEITTLLENYEFEINDSALSLKVKSE